MLNVCLNVGPVVARYRLLVDTDVFILREARGRAPTPHSLWHTERTWSEHIGTHAVLHEHASTRAHNAWAGPRTQLLRVPAEALRIVVQLARFFLPKLAHSRYPGKQAEELHL